MNALEKIRKLKKASQANGGSRRRGIFLQFRMGPNTIRLVGEPIEVKNHYLGENKRFEHDPRGLIRDDADGVAKMINCSDWNIDIEEPKEEKSCLICKLNEIANAELKKADNDMTPADEGYLKELRSKGRARSVLKWNVIDRDDPNIVEQTDEGDKEVFGYKIANIGPEAWNDIEGIFTQVGFDISDPDKGIDICVVKSQGQNRVTYSVRAVMEEGSVVRTPLTDDEKETDLLDIKQICGRQTDQRKLFDALHDDYQQLLRVYGFEPADSDEQQEEQGQDEEQSEEQEEIASEEEPDESENTNTEESDDSASEEEEKDGSDDKQAVESESESSDSKEDKSSDDEKSDDNVDPSFWQCFGTIEVDHPECKSCDHKEACAKKAGVELTPKKKKAKKVAGK
jgi:hypothetical protein